VDMLFLRSYVSGQTDRQTDALITILRTAFGGEVIRINMISTRVLG